MRLLYALVAAACASLVSAHGYLEVFTANGKEYKGPGPLEEDGPAMPNSPIRRIGANGPVSDVNSPDMACGVGNPPATGGIAQVSAGSEVQFQMSAWPHDIGPLTTYMGKCPDTSDKCDASKLKWFKVDAKALKDDGTTWYQADIAAGQPGVATIPAGLEEGYYLLRYEIMALHKAATTGGAEFFISCTQIQVVDGGSAKPSTAQLVAFPGAYRADDPGILVDVYTFFTKYTYPGPELFDGANGSGGGEDPAPPSTSREPSEPTSTEATSTEPSEPTSTEPSPPTSTDPSEPTPTTESSEPTSTESSDPTSTDSSEPTSTPTSCKRKRALRHQKRGPAYKAEITRSVVPVRAARRSNMHRKRSH